MNRRDWMADVESATTRGRCRWYVTARTAAQRHGAICRRTGTLTLTVGNLLPEGPYCRQHGLIAQDRATAAAIGTDRRVRLEAIPAGEPQPSRAGHAGSCWATHPGITHLAYSQEVPS